VSRAIHRTRQSPNHRRGSQPASNRTAISRSSATNWWTSWLATLRAQPELLAHFHPHCGRHASAKTTSTPSSPACAQTSRGPLRRGGRVIARPHGSMETLETTIPVFVNVGRRNRGFKLASGALTSPANIARCMCGYRRPLQIDEPSSSNGPPARPRQAAGILLVLICRPLVRKP